MPEEVLALLIAHNFRLKGVATLLRAMQCLVAQGREVRLVVVGGKRLGWWRGRARSLGLDRRVTFAGLVDDTVPYYAAADMYVHPTFYDSCSLVVLEAAACGLPIITSRYNGAAELFREPREIRLISDPGDARELAAAMAGLLDEPVRRRMGLAARQVALAHTFERQRRRDPGSLRSRATVETGSFFMRIGLAIEHLDPRRGGAEQWTFQHVERLLARGHEVHVVAGVVSGPAAELPLRSTASGTSTGARGGAGRRGRNRPPRR